MSVNQEFFARMDNMLDDLRASNGVRIPAKRIEDLIANWLDVVYQSRIAAGLSLEETKRMVQKSAPGTMSPLFTSRSAELYSRIKSWRDEAVLNQSKDHYDQQPAYTRASAAMRNFVMDQWSGLTNGSKEDNAFHLLVNKAVLQYKADEGIHPK